MFFLPRVSKDLYHRQPMAQDADLKMRYLGTAGFVLEGEGRTLVIDPFITRPGLITTVTRRLVTNEELLKEVIPHADDVLIGHAHHDHILDAPSLCHRTGARLIGSPSACNVGRAAGLPESQLVETRGREVIMSGNAKLCGLPSRHGKVYFGRVTLPGDIPEPARWPARYYELRHGLVLNWHIEMAGLSVVHVDSADFIEEELEGVHADVVCLCAIGRKYRPGYVETAVRMLKPKYIIPCHWDYFFTHYREDPRYLPGVNLPGFIEEIRQAGVEPIVLPIDGSFGLSAAT